MLYHIVFITSAFFVTSDDSSRVKLSIIHGSPYDDYINANYMPVRTDAPQSCSLARSFLHHQQQLVLLLSIRLIEKMLSPSSTSMSETLLKKETNMSVFYVAGLQLQEGVHCSSGSSARHCQRFLENDLGEERADSGHADTLQRARTSEQQHNILTVTRAAPLNLRVSVSGQM